MKISTAFKISGLCLAALGAEMVMAYVIWSSYAFNQAETGEYRAADAYAEGPMATLAMVFYVIFGITTGVMVGAPVLALLLSWIRK